MSDYQFWTIIGMLAGGFGWIIHQIKELEGNVAKLETRLTVVETILAMFEVPLKSLMKGQLFGISE